MPKTNNSAAKDPPVDLGSGAADDMKDGLSIDQALESKSLDAAVAESEDLRQRLLRWQADFENLRRRAAREVMESRQMAEGDFAKDLLDILDHFESALAVDTAKTDAATILRGVKITYDEFGKVLKRKGIESYDPTGQAFDPHLHEAIMQEEKAGVEPMVVLQTFQRGYRIGDRILRPAKVKVSK